MKALRAFDQRKIVNAVETHLRHAPTQTSRSRIKKMTEPFPCQYRLRVDDFRIYYDVDEEGRKVDVLRIYHKGQEPTPEAEDEENRTDGRP